MGSLLGRSSLLLGNSVGEIFVLRCPGLFLWYPIGGGLGDSVVGISVLWYRSLFLRNSFAEITVVGFWPGLLFGDLTGGISVPLYGPASWGLYWQDLCTGVAGSAFGGPMGGICVLWAWVCFLGTSLVGSLGWPRLFLGVLGWPCLFIGELYW